MLGTTPAEVSGVMINRQSCSLDAEIPDGAEVILVTPMGGG